MGCTSSKVGQQPAHGLVATNLGTSAKKPPALSARAEETRSARLVTDDSAAIKAGTQHYQSATNESNSDGHSQPGVQVEGETITDESGLLMRTPRSNERGIHFAARNGDLPLVHELLGIPGSTASNKTRPATDSGENENASDKTVPNTPTADVNERGMWGNTPLLVATQYAHSQVALALIEGGADARAKNERHATALHYTCAEGLTDVGIALLSKGAEADPPAAVVHHPCMDDSRPVSLTPLLAASIGGHTALVRLLVENGADVNQQVVPYGLRQDPELEREVGGEPYRGGGRGMSALMGAARYGHAETCLQLVNHGASLLAEDTEQRTALVHAIQGCHGEIAQAMLDAARATGDARRLSEMAELSAGDDCLGRSPLHLACDKMLPAVVKALLVAGAGVETRDVGGATPLLHACRKSCLQSTREIIGRGGSVTALDKGGNTPLTVAKSRENEPGGKEMLELVEAAAAARPPEQVSAIDDETQQAQTDRITPPPETDENSRLSETDGNTPVAETVANVQVMEPENQNMPAINGVATANQSADGAQAAYEHGQDDEDEDVLLVSDWVSEEVRGSDQVWDDTVLIAQEQQQLPRDGSIPDTHKLPHNNETNNTGGLVDAKDLLPEDDEDVLFVADYVPELEAAEGEGLATKTEAGGEGVVAMEKASIEEGNTGPAAGADRSAEVAEASLDGMVAAAAEVATTPLDQRSPCDDDLPRDGYASDRSRGG